MNRRLFTLGIFFLLLQGRSVFASTTADALVADAWKAWEQNNKQLVEAKFLAAIKEDPRNTRAALGLSLLYILQKKNAASWERLKTVMQPEPDSYPYLYSLWTTAAMRNRYYDLNVDLVPLVEQLSRKADSGGVLKGMAAEVLGGYFERRGDIATSNRYYQQIHEIKDWMLIGPFDNTSASGFDKFYPPELEYEPSKTYEAKNGIPANWFKLATGKNDRWIEFTRYFSNNESVFYANDFVYSPKKQSVQIRIGTSGSLKAFLNDEQIAEFVDETNNDLDNYIVEADLQEGWNRLLIKCGFSEISKCNFLARITDLHGEPIDGLALSTESKPYKCRPGANSRLIPNFAEAFFKTKITAAPGNLENYALLAECYLRNEKAIEAELALREAMKLAPGCGLFKKQLLEAYRQGKKYDNYATMIEQIYALDKDNVDILQYKIDEHLEKHELDKADALTKHLETIAPRSEFLYETRVHLYSEKDQDEKLAETIKTAYGLYPDNWRFVLLAASLSIQETRKYDRAISIVQKYLARRYDTTALSTLAGLYLQASNVKKWEETCNKIFELDAASTQQYYVMAKAYFTIQDYANAEVRIKKSLALCHDSALFWSQLGEINRARGAIELAKHAYTEALKYDPTDYDARRELRELDGKKPVFAVFEQANIDDLIKNAPATQSYPDSGAVVLLSDTKRVAYEPGGSESSAERLIRVFNNRGIDAFKEYLIPHSPYNEELVVEKAVVVKKAGTEINADVEENHIVFKSLEPNDLIYLKWNIRSLYTGKLFKDFWDNLSFNGAFPVKDSRYSLLVPKGLRFHANTQNMPNEPSKKDTDEGTVYLWRLVDEPALEPEDAMPAWADVTKDLYISSVNEWQDIVNWYLDLARTKTRSSFEVKEQVEALLRKDNLSQEAKIQVIYDFITENIRYSRVPFRQSGLIPLRARDVLVNRIGDCKDLATLCIAMLSEVGIKAHYVLVNTREAGENRNAPPSIPFNHCIVGVEMPGGFKYLDLTAYNYPMNSAPEGDVEAFSLLLKPGVNKPEYLPRNGFTSRQLIRRSIVDIRDDKSIAARNSLKAEGAPGALLRGLLRQKSKKQQEMSFSQLLSQDFPDVKLTKLELGAIDSREPFVECSYDYEVPNYLGEAGQFKVLKIPWAEPFRNDPGLARDNRKFPYYYWPWADTMTEEIEIKLPAGFEPVEPMKDVNITSEVADYSVKLEFANGVIKGSRKLVNKKMVVSPEQYPEFKKFYAAVVKEDQRVILLRGK
ncbi:MAG TPA: DUF3857 domain-containing protein [Blastocatellia bacterium]|nr:DUF3857 domain-containing protein [Blastocatellia bacterium]